MKSSQKSKDGNKSKDSKTISKSEDRVSRKSKDSTPKSGSSKPVAAAKKMSNKSKNPDTSKISDSKDDDTSKPKSAAKSKQETQRSGKSKQETLKTAISRGKPLKSGGKSDVNGTGKVKSGLLKRKYAEDENSDAWSKFKMPRAWLKDHQKHEWGSEVKSGRMHQRTYKWVFILAVYSLTVSG